jgi:hypothetical protein
LDIRLTGLTGGGLQALLRATAFEELDIATNRDPCPERVGIGVDAQRFIDDAHKAARLFAHLGMTLSSCTFVPNTPSSTRARSERRDYSDVKLGAVPSTGTFSDLLNGTAAKSDQ